MLIIIIKDKALRIKKNLFENMKDSCMYYFNICMQK